jgi:hypothetical protein
MCRWKGGTSEQQSGRRAQDCTQASLLVGVQHWGSDGGIIAAKGWCPWSFHSREEARMTAHWIAITLGGAAALGRLGAPMSNGEFYLRAALVIFGIVALSTAAIRMAK